MKKNNIKKEKLNKLYNKIIVLLVICIIVSGSILLFKKEEYNNTTIEIEESILNNEEIVIEESIESQINSLKSKYSNNDIIAILSIDDEINTPIAQGKDNQYYLKRSLSLKRSVIGSVFMDYRVDSSSKQINIYGHNSTKYNPPFKTLEGYLNEKYYNEHRTITLKIDNEIKEYEIFSIVLADKSSTEEHMNIKYKTNNEWLNHFNRLKNRSIYDSDITLNENDSIIVLQTCLFGSNKGKLMVVVGKLKEA